MADVRGALGDGGTPMHPNEATLAAFLDGELPEAEAEEVEQHLEACRECRTLIGGAARVLAEEGLPREVATTERTDRVITVASTDVAQPRRNGIRVAMALAASIVLILLVRPRFAPPPGIDTVRSAAPVAAPGEGLAVLEVYLPANGDTVRAEGLTFTWGATAAERYKLVLATDDGTPVWSIDTRDTTIALHDSVALRPGALYFWHADAVGGGLAASTRVQRFIVRR